MSTMPPYATKGNVRKPKTHCKKGHEFSPDNVLPTRYGGRQCKKCNQGRQSKYILKQKAAGLDKHALVCPTCKLVRYVTKESFKRNVKLPRECISCSRKHVRKGMRFTPGNCNACGKIFIRLSGATKYCDECSGRTPAEPRECPICKRPYVGYVNKKACSASCLRRLRLNHTYFGGRLFDTEGWEDKACVMCEKHVPKRFHVHHVYGHPNHSKLVIMCPGCHDAVSKLAARKNMSFTVLRRLSYLVMAQHTGSEPDVSFTEVFE